MIILLIFILVIISGRKITKDLEANNLWSYLYVISLTILFYLIYKG